MFSLLWLVELGIAVGVILLFLAGFLGGRDDKKLYPIYLGFGAGFIVLCCTVLFYWNCSKVGTPSDLYAELSYKVISRTGIGADTYIVDLQEIYSKEYFCIKTQSRLTPKSGIAHIAKIAGVWDLVEVETPIKTAEIPKSENK